MLGARSVVSGARAALRSLRVAVVCYVELKVLNAKSITGLAV